MAFESKLCRVLFLCTDNSVRSIMAEALLNKLGRGRFAAFSAGSAPAGRVHPSAIGLLKSRGIPVEGIRCKSWEEFRTQGNDSFNFVFSVCGDAAQEICPIWPGQPLNAHWKISDPTVHARTAAEIGASFSQVFRMLNQRIELFVNLPFEALERVALQERIENVCGSRGENAYQERSVQLPRFGLV